MRDAHTSSSLRTIGAQSALSLPGVGRKSATARFYRGLASAALLLAAVSHPSLSIAADRAPSRSAASTKDTAEITDLLTRYFVALNASDIGIADLYSEDGVFLQLFKPTSVGKDSVRQAYAFLFTQEKMSLASKIDEIVQISPGWAFARASTTGPFTMIPTGGIVDDPTQILILLKKEKGAWRIARFSFSPTDLPAGLRARR